MLSLIITRLCPNRYQATNINFQFSPGLCPLLCVCAHGNWPIIALKKWTYVNTQVTVSNRKQQRAIKVHGNCPIMWQQVKSKHLLAHFIGIFPVFSPFLAPALHYSISVDRFHCSSIAATTKHNSGMVNVPH